MQLRDFFRHVKQVATPSKRYFAETEVGERIARQMPRPGIVCKKATCRAARREEARLAYRKGKKILKGIWV